MPLRLNGSTSGYSQIDAPAVAGDQTFTLPGTGGVLIANSNLTSYLPTRAECVGVYEISGSTPYATTGTLNLTAIYDPYSAITGGNTFNIPSLGTYVASGTGYTFAPSRFAQYVGLYFTFSGNSSPSTGNATVVGALGMGNIAGNGNYVLTNNGFGGSAAAKFIAAGGTMKVQGYQNNDLPQSQSWYGTVSIFKIA